MQINAIDYFEKGALLRCKEKVAVIDQGRSYTFEDIGRCAKNCAALILRRTKAMRWPIPVFLPKSAESIIADQAILYSGNGYANLDIKSPPQRLKGMLDNLAAELIITSKPCADTLRSLGIPDEKLLFIEGAMVSETLFDNDLLLKRLDGII